MNPNLDEWRARRNAAAPKPDQTVLQTIVREAARLEVLTQDENWNFYLTFLQSFLTATNRLAEHYNTKLRDPMIVNADEVSKLRAALTMADARIATLEQIMAIPKMLTEDKEKAKKMISDMERDAPEYALTSNSS